METYYKPGRKRLSRKALRDLSQFGDGTRVQRKLVIAVAEGGAGFGRWLPYFPV